MKKQKNTPNKLNQIPKKETFKAPDGYFNGLSDKVMKRISEEKPSTESNTGKEVKIDWRYVAGLAASIALIVVAIISWPGEELEQPTSYASIIEEIPTTELVAYLEFSELSTDEIIGELKSEDFGEEVDKLPSIQFEEEEIDALLEMYEEPYEPENI